MTTTEASPGDHALLIYCSCPDQPVAEEITRRLVAQRLAACVSQIPGIKSTYRWQQQIESSSEILLLIKSTRQRYPALQQMICELHPYELPEIIAVPVEQGLAGFLDWISQCTNPES